MSSGRTGLHDGSHCALSPADTSGQASPLQGVRNPVGEEPEQISSVSSRIPCNSHTKTDTTLAFMAVSLPVQAIRTKWHNVV